MHRFCISKHVPWKNHNAFCSYRIVHSLSNWSRLSSLWPLLYATSCCFIEFASLIGSRFDFDRYGLVPRSSPRQADLILTAGTVTMKMAPSLVRLYEQMPEPKYVIAMGACTITGGMFSTDSYSTVRGVDKLIHVDVYLPGCPVHAIPIIIYYFLLFFTFQLCCLSSVEFAMLFSGRSKKKIMVPK
ncbi:hypothetical protein ABFS82_06G143300 [Erythranthe guttata]